MSDKEKEKKNMQGEKQLNNSQSECCYREMKAKYKYKEREI